MSFRFKRRIRLFPGIYLNIGKTGISTSIGPRGANINISKRGTYLNTGIPGTGMSWRQKVSGTAAQSNAPVQPLIPRSMSSGKLPPPLPFTNRPILPKDSTSEVVTSEGLLDLSEQIREMRKDRKQMALEIIQTKSEIRNLNEFQEKKKKQWFSSKDDISKVQKRIGELGKILIQQESSLIQSQSELDFDLEPSLQDQYQKVVSCFAGLTKCEKIWDITSSKVSDLKGGASRTRSIVERSPVVFDFQRIEDIASKYEPLHMQNANGADLYFFPACIILKNHANDLVRTGTWVTI